MKTRSQTRAANRPVPSPSIGHQVAPVVDSANHAFSIDLIREKILSYAIHRTHSKGLSLQNLRSCRLVHSSSLETISKLLRYNREPLFHFSLDQENPLMDQFIGTVKPDANSATLPFKLYLKPGFFIQPNFQHLGRLLTLCGDGLVELDIVFPGDGGSMLFFFPTALHFPLLQKISATFSEEDMDKGYMGKTGSLLYLLQPIMHGCQELKTFDVPLTSHAGLNPAGFANLTLPPTLTEVTLGSKLGSKDLQILINNPLLRLRNLAVIVSNAQHNNGLVFRILKNFRLTLESFIIGEDIEEAVDERRPPTIYSFPVMPKLQCLGICMRDWQLEEDLPTGFLQQCLPKLQDLSLIIDDDDVFAKWTQGQRLNTVRELLLRLVFSWATEVDPVPYRSILPSDIDCINRVFPNVTTLDILVTGRELSGLQILFTKLTKLTDLTVEVRDTESVTKCSLWDSLLIGNIKKNKPSIRNLKELQKLSLETVESPPDLQNVSLISGAVFTKALFQMPKLTQLVFRGRFRVTPHMKQRWEREGNGRTIFYYEEE